MVQFTKVILATGSDGQARFHEEAIELPEGTPASQLSAMQGASSVQFRYSPAGFRSQVHCTKNPQWVFILSGAMEIGVADGSSRIFRAGEHFFSADTLPEGATLDPAVHGHWSREVGNEPLVTLFIRP